MEFTKAGWGKQNTDAQYNINGDSRYLKQIKEYLKNGNSQNDVGVELSIKDIARFYPEHNIINPLPIGYHEICDYIEKTLNIDDRNRDLARAVNAGIFNKKISILKHLYRAINPLMTVKMGVPNLYAYIIFSDQQFDYNITNLVEGFYSKRNVPLVTLGPMTMQRLPLIFKKEIEMLREILPQLGIDVLNDEPHMVLYKALAHDIPIPLAEIGFINGNVTPQFYYGKSFDNNRYRAIFHKSFCDYTFLEKYPEHKNTIQDNFLGYDCSINSWYLVKPRTYRVNLPEKELELYKQEMRFLGYDNPFNNLVKVYDEQDKVNTASNGKIGKFYDRHDADMITDLKLTYLSNIDYDMHKEFNKDHDEVVGDLNATFHWKPQLLREIFCPRDTYREIQKRIIKEHIGDEVFNRLEPYKLPEFKYIPYATNLGQDNYYF